MDAHEVSGEGRCLEASRTHPRSSLAVSLHACNANEKGPALASRTPESDRVDLNWCRRGSSQRTASSRSPGVRFSPRVLHHLFQDSFTLIGPIFRG